jgi:hypothetical protein
VKKGWVILGVVSAVFMIQTSLAILGLLMSSPPYEAHSELLYLTYRPLAIKLLEPSIAIQAGIATEGVAYTRSNLAWKNRRYLGS